MSQDSRSVQPHSPTSTQQKQGRAFLVGAGPGDPSLLTLRAKECLEAADVVLYDGLANPRSLELAPQAEWICVGKHGQTPIWTQARINQELLKLVQAGHSVVRLKGGDPAVFARTAEELEVLADAEVPFEVVPGITAALAAASYVGIPITHRDHASAVAFVTGQQAEKSPQEIDWEALARFPGTLVFYMGVTTVKQWTSRLLEAGLSGATPTAIVRRCTWSDQQVYRCCLSEVAEMLTPASKLRPPVIVIVGAVAELGQNFDWFSQKPLLGFGVLVTRPFEQALGLGKQLEDLGAEVYYQPAITIEAVEDQASLRKVVASFQADPPDGITFSSANSVQHFMTALYESGLDARALGPTKLAVVGPATAEALTKHNLRADFVPNVEEEYSAAGIVKHLEKRGVVGRWVVTTSNKSSRTLPIGLEKLGCEVIELPTYRAQTATQLDPLVEQALTAGRIDFCTVTSSAIATALVDLMTALDCNGFLSHIRPVALSESIARNLAGKHAWHSPLVASSNTDEALIACLLDHVDR